MRAVFRLPVKVQFPLPGRSLRAVECVFRLLSNPQVTRTMPLGSKVAV